MWHSERSENWHKRWSERSVRAKVLVIVGVAVMVPAFLALFGAVTMWLWNWLMPTIFKLPEIGFWQAIGLLLLAHIFFKGGQARRAGKAQWRRAKLRERMREDEPEAKNVA
jgi:sterol desaturase/sphingolipid hydroxylase (fatty acid hydroxylase superfamily)